MKAHKLRKVNLNELRVRGAQFLAMIGERYVGSSLNHLATSRHLLEKLTHRRFRCEQELFQTFQERSEPKFFGSFNERVATLQEFQHRFPHQALKIIERADSIVSGRFHLMGFENLSFGEPVDWHLEPVSGRRSPNLHWTRVNFLDADLVGDKKIVWELNRHQYFATLGQAYWLTGHQKYAETFASHVNSWMDHNPPKLGINWASSLEIAFRSISWIWALYFFKDSPALTANTFMRVLKFLYLNARHLETYLSTYFSPNTHLTGEALGLFYLGTFLPEFKDCDRWRTTGFRILMDQLSKHVKPDGVYFEQSSYYHRYTTDFYLHFLILLRANGDTVPLEVERSLVRLLDHLMYITRPDGSTPLFGDDDGGRLATLSLRAANDFRGTLATGAAVFGRADYKYVAGEALDEALWLLGANSIGEFDRVEPKVPAKDSRAFKDGGYYLMRDGWTTTSNYLWFDCGAHGTLNCGHAHADVLSFELAAGGRTILVDPGTYTYTGSIEMRDWFRSSAAHNALTIDGKSSSLPDGPFSWKTIARSETLNWTSRQRFDFIEGGHDGYVQLQQPVALTRSLMFLKRDYWILRDNVTSGGDHRTDLWFHFDPSVNPLMKTTGTNETMLSIDNDKEGIDIRVFAEGNWRREDTWVSPCYGKKIRAQTYAFSSLIRGNGELLTFLLPQSSGATRRAVAEIQAIGGRAFEVTHDGGVDIVMIRGRGEEHSWVETARMKSDFDWTWARFCHNDDCPEEFVLLAGKNLKIEGREILKSALPMADISGRRVGDGFQVETSDGTFNLSLPIINFESRFASSSQVLYT